MTKLEELTKKINKDFKSTVVIKGQPDIWKGPVIPFSSPMMQHMTYGGLPRGKLIEFFGDENSGKTTTALDVIKNAQIVFRQEWLDEMNSSEDKKRVEYLRETGAKRVVFIDTEHTLDFAWAAKIGVDVGGMYYFKPDDQSAEQILDIALSFMESGEVGLVVLDSIAAMLSQREFDKDVEEKTMGGISQALTTFSKKAVQACKRNDCIFLGINQKRDDLSMYGTNPYKTPGGRAFKFLCMVRMEFRKGRYVDEKGMEVNAAYGTPTGHYVQAVIVKTKAFPGDRKQGSYLLKFHEGIAVVDDLVATGILLGVIAQAGAWFTIDGYSKPVKEQGKASLIATIKADKDLESWLATAIQEAYAKQ